MLNLSKGMTPVDPQKQGQAAERTFKAASVIADISVYLPSKLRCRC
jgi:hypothetical protein